MNAWTTQHAIEHIVAPAESHRLALVERRHVTLRRAIEIYMDDMKVTGTKGIRQALTYVVPQLNDTVSVAGYSPSQWLLGKVPRLPGGLMQEELAPAHLGGHDQFEQLLQQRAAAKRALISADLDAKLRRALPATVPRHRPSFADRAEVLLLEGSTTRPLGQDQMAWPCQGRHG